MTNLITHIEQARSCALAGDLEGALREYEIALRMVTPDDYEIEYAMALAAAQKRFSSTSADPRADALDSGLRAEIVDVLRHLGRFAEARHHAEIALYLDRFLGNHNDISASLHDLGLINLALGQEEKALEYFQESDAIDSELRSSGQVGGALDFRKLIRGGVLADYGFMQEALMEIEGALPRIENNFPEPLKVVDALNSASQALQNLGEHARAIDFLRRAIRLQQSISSSHPQLGRLYANLAIIFHERRDFKSCEDWLGRLREMPPTLAERSSGYSLADLLGEERRRQESWIAAGAREDGGGRTKSHDVFVSYNTKDEAVVAQLHDALERFGLSAWTFKEFEDWQSLKPVSEIVRAVESEIERSRLVLIVATGTSITSEYVFAEIRHALAKDIPVAVWYPSGVRLVPQDAATRTDLSADRLRAIKQKLVGFGVHAF
jgi:tetratricopeptide (TPR) repeat protein